MGYALALAALGAGHKVILITTIEKSEIRNQKSKLRIVPVETAAEMFDCVQKHFYQCDCLIMAAAVADYTPVKKSKIKIKKANKNLVIKLRPTVDILKWAGKTKKKNQVVIGFALEDKNLKANAEKKLKEKKLDMIIGNTPTAIGSDQICVEIKTPYCRWLKLPHASKTSIAQRIVTLAENL
jgi:phosphopantothenoylcysteine decarboxylase/phosphopantothenate--cysteine ligase